MSGRAKIVLLGMLSKIPVAGPAWLLVHYMEALRRLGYEPYYVEAHARTPSMFMQNPADDASANAAAFIERVLSRFGFGDRWAFHALHEDGGVYGLSEGGLRRLYASADLIVNLHGGTVPLPEHAETGRLVYLETDPVELQVELRNGVQAAIDFVEPHVAFFSWGLNYGSPDCRVPLPERYPFRPSPPPVLLDFWGPDALPPRPMFTTIGNWEQRWRTVELDGETYHWSKHHEFMKFLELPRVVECEFELALASCGAEDRELLVGHGWNVIDALGFSTDLDAYRTYVRGSQGEFTVAKDQNVRLRSGWFSERSATYLAAGRPVITQETGFSNVLPTGEGLFGFSTLDEILAAVEAVQSDYDRHARAAREIAREYFDAEVVLGRLLAELGLPPARWAGRADLVAADGTGDIASVLDGAEPAAGDGRPPRSTLVARLLALRAEAAEKGELPAVLGASQAEAYRAMIDRIRGLVDAALPQDAHVLVVGKGDNELLRLGGRRASHFPQAESGVYAGHHPADSRAAIAHLELHRQRGAEYLLLPQTALWWLDYYGDFEAELERSGRLVIRRDDTCRVYALTDAAAERAHRKIERGAGNAMAEAADDSLSGLEETELRVELARLLLSQGRVAEAGDVVDEGLRWDGDHPRLLLALARCQEAIGDQAAARALVARASMQAGDDYSANLELARYAWEQGRLSVAERELTRLVERYPDDDVAADELIRLSCSRLEDGGPTDAALVERFAERADGLLAEERVSAAALLRVAEVLAEVRRPKQALAMLTAALDRTTLADEAVRALATRLLRDAAPAAAFEDRRTLAILLTQTGNAYHAANDIFHAEACWRLAQAAAPDHPASAFNLAFRAIADGDPLAAMSRLGRFRRVYSQEAGMICWPSANGVPWPHARIPLVGAFEQLKPACRPWPRITVVTPSFNQAAYVEETVLSVLNQDYPDVEYIVVDGVSTDGSVEILRRYEPRLARLIVEPDRGQSDALNKGLRAATGELVLWVNSDDMLAPGALLMAASAYLSGDAEIFAGFCLEHDERRFGVINLPAVTRETFNTVCLGDLFGYWLKGHYFYQPEVVFTRRLLEQVGGELREDLNYTMDYEFWLRCAAAGATVSVVHWPVALFRKHTVQKTSDLDPTIIEQGKVRDGFLVPKPSFERLLDIRTRLRQALVRPRPRLLVVSTRADKIFSGDTGAELAESLHREGLEVAFRSDLDLDAARHCDLVVLLLHLYREHESLRKVRESGVTVPVIGWAWDNHHHAFANHRAAADVDVLVPGHAFASEYLRSTAYVLAASLPLCVTQWTADEALRFFTDSGQGSRSDDLYGGFVRYAFAARRNRLVEELRAAGMEGVYFLEEDALDEYFGLAPEERFGQWASHKASLCLPLHADLSQRFFDALATGQIPIVPRDVPDLERVVPPRLREELPIVLLPEYSVSAVREAHEEALAAFDADGIEGARRRHRFALGNHMFVARVRKVAAAARRLAEGGE